MTCVEMLLSNESGSITKNISERVAFILMKEPEKRRIIYETVKKLYKKRSCSIHAGNRKVSESDVREAQSIVRSIIFLMVSKKIKSSKGLIEYADNLKFK